MRRLSALLLMLPLFLAACSDTEDSIQSGVTAPEATTSMVAPVTAQIGDPIEVTCFWNDCIGEVTLTDMTVAEECRYGVADYGEGYNQAIDGKEILQLWGEFSLAKGRVGQNGEELNVSLDDPTAAIDAEGFKQTPTRYQCQSADDGHESWSTVLTAGQKARIYGDFLIPEGATVIVIEGREIELPAREETTQAPAQERAASTAAAEQPLPTTMWTEPGVGYQCFGTDAWTNDPANCTAANLGGDPSYDTQWGPAAAIPADETVQDLSNVPYADGGTCPAYLCGYGTNDQGQRNPTSGEIQTLHGCQEGYINDPELCEAVAWVETHQY